LIFLAERRAQLSRSRSRQNLFQLDNTTLTEISYDNSGSETPPSSQNKDRNRGDKERDKNYNHEKTGEISNTKSKHSSNVDSDESEAEKLLARLKAL
jgi:hypothetical protein